MIKILIEKVTTIQYKEKQNLVTEEIPSDQRKAERYGSGEEVIYAKKYQVVDVEKTKEITAKLLQQELPDDGFDLGSVILAVNGLTKGNTVIG